ncbi:hypothetical protein N7475_000159 [Penicillium sp. IBT 31633x]|nr:hypothetical protein N7475_000159 [Penicillium sp. IBT 31633x]
MTTSITTVEDTTSPTCIPRGLTSANVIFYSPPPDNAAPYNYVESPPPGHPQRNYLEQEHSVPLTDIRNTESSFTLDKDAFQTLKQVPTKTTYTTFDSDTSIREIYYPEVSSLLLSSIPGAHKVVLFDHTIRRQKDGAPRQPVTRAHVDQTPRAAENRVRLHIPDPDEAEKLLQGRYRIVNVWGSLSAEPVQSAPLAFASATSVDGKDLVPIEHRYPNRVGQTMGVRYNKDQAWFYWSETIYQPHPFYPDATAHPRHPSSHPPHPQTPPNENNLPPPPPKTQSPKHFLGGNIHPALQTYISTVATPSAHSRILPAIKHDHLELEAHSHKILTSKNADEQTRFQNQFTWELARHLAGEELIVYPALISSLTDGQKVVDRNRLEHQGVKQQLKTFQELASKDPQSVPTLKGLMIDFGAHARHEEDVDLPRLEEFLSKEESVELTKELDRMKIFVPSRAHPLAPTEPFFEEAVRFLMAPIDYLADLFRKWSDGRK